RVDARKTRPARLEKARLPPWFRRRVWPAPRLLSQLCETTSMDDLHHGSGSRFDEEYLIGHEGIFVVGRSRHQFDDRFRQRLELDRIGDVGADCRAKTYGRRILLCLPVADALIDG